MKRDLGLGIDKDKMLYALKKLKTGKAWGPEQLPSEILKLIEEDRIYVLLELFNAIYRTEIIP